MPHHPVPDPGVGFLSRLPRPWLLLIAANLLVLLAACLRILGELTEVNPAIIRIFLVLGSNLLAAIAINVRLRDAAWDWASRVESAAVVSLAGLVALGSYLSMDRSWVSGHMFYGAAFMVSVAGSTLILLPSLARRLVLTLWLLFHFTGMAVCITSVDPPSSQGPWLAKQLYGLVYQPYLQFLYMTNAYHFYSPDPGPPSMYRFYVHFDDGSMTSVPLPSRSASPIGMHYQRMLALPEHTFQAINRLPYTGAELTVLQQEMAKLKKDLEKKLKEETDRTSGRYRDLEKQLADVKSKLVIDADRGSWEQIYQRREIGSTMDFIDPSTERAYPIPMVADLDVNTAYKEPTDFHKRIIASVARRILWTTKPPREGAKATSVKVYRVTLQILSPAELAEGISPVEKSKQWVYFLGEFNPQAEQINKMDPFLYWFLPIAWVPPTYPYHGLSTRPGIPAVQVRGVIPKDRKDYFLLDSMEIHAAGKLRKAPAEEKK